MDREIGSSQGRDDDRGGVKKKKKRGGECRRESKSPEGKGGRLRGGWKNN